MKTILELAAFDKIACIKRLEDYEQNPRTPGSIHDRWMTSAIQQHEIDVLIIQAQDERIKALRAALGIAHNACGVAATLLMFHGRPSPQLDNCVANLKQNDKRGEKALASDDLARESILRGEK